MKRRRRFAMIIVIILIAVMVLSLALTMVKAEETDSAGETGDVLTVPAEMPASHAVYIDCIDVTNMSVSQAEKAVSDHMEKLKKDKIYIKAGAGTAVTTAGALGLDYANKNVVNEALSIGRKGNVLKRFLAGKEISENGSIVLDLDLKVDRSSVADVIRIKEVELNTEPMPNALSMSEDRSEFIVTEPKSGVTIDEAAAVDTLVSYMENEWNGGAGEVVLPAAFAEAQDTTEELKKVRNVLGSGETVFDVEKEGRVVNIAIATDHINGTVLYPGEEFSSVETIGPTTAEYGFMPGASYAGNRIVDTYGGGVCQVTSTLYQAVLEAELTVTERHNHTMPIHYAQPGMDATMSEDDLDFRFMNSTEAPIYIEGFVDEDTVHFSIYGEDTRDPERSISFESREIAKTDYETVYIADAEVDFGELQEIYGEKGVQAELWKIIYRNGEYESEEKVNASLYNPIDHAYIVGTKGASADTVAAINNAVANESLGLITDAIGTGTMAEPIEVPED